jgi:hypothetical protein
MYVSWSLSLLGWAERPYPIVDTGQKQCYDQNKAIPTPNPGEAFSGQDAQHQGLEPKYRNNGDETVSDLNTGLMWSREVALHKVSLVEAKKLAAQLTLGGYSDWRVPTVKELYSLMDFRGVTGIPAFRGQKIPSSSVPYIDTDVFDFAYGQTESGERYMDAQWLSSTEYVHTTMWGSKTLFGVNFADGRIKGYGYELPHGRGEKKFYVRFVRGNPAYGINDFVENGNGTVTDRATGLMWTRADSGKGMTWEEALKIAETASTAGHTDWRLPNAKELQSIVDYSRSPDTTDSAAIDSVFSCTEIQNEAGQKDWGYYWTSTTHMDGPDARQAVVICFGRGIGQMHGKVMDVHGAGAQRSDPKTGQAEIGRGPQGDARRVNNLVRLVRDVD